MRSFKPLAAVALLCAPALSQLTHVIPNGFTSTPGSSSNAFPWSSTSSLWPGLRTIGIYDATNFTNAGINSAVIISRLRWRAAPTTGSWTGGNFARVTVQMATATVTAGTISATQSANFGPDLTVVSTGPVAHIAGAGNGLGVPGPWVVDLQLTTPFVYNPQLGGLAIDVDISNNGGISYTGGATPQLDVDAGPATLAGRLWSSALYPATNGTAAPHGIVVEMTYTPTSGGPIATRTNYGQGCYDRARSYYQLFNQASQFNLAGTATSTNTVMHILASNGYVVVPNVGQWFTPLSTALTLGEDAEVAVPLPFTFPFPGGTATQLFICSNGFISPGATNGTAIAPNVASLLTGGPRFCPYWHDLSPPSGGQIFFDVDAPNGAAYVTWNNVATRNGGGTNTFQAAFFQTGIVEYRYRAMSGQATTTPSLLVGWSPGANARNPGSRAIATSLPFNTDPADMTPLTLNASARPVLGNAINLLTTEIPPGTSFGAMIMSFTRIDPGQSLAPIGMSGCFQYLSLDAAVVFTTATASHTFPINIPSNPIHTGTFVRCQSATFSPGLNPLGVLASNGVELLLNPQ